MISVSNTATYVYISDRDTIITVIISIELQQSYLCFHCTLFIKQKFSWMTLMARLHGWKMGLFASSSFLLAKVVNGYAL